MRLLQRRRPVDQERFSEMAAWHEWPIDEIDHWRRGWHTNVGAAERVASAVIGGALGAFGLSRRSVPGWLLTALGGYGVYRGISGHCPVYQALGIDGTQTGRAEPRDFFERGIHVSESIVVNRPADDLFEYWRDLTNLPSIMSHLKSVKVLDECRSHWVAQGPMGSSIEWDAEIINEEPHELIAWRSLEGAGVDNAGSVRFLPLHVVGGHSATEVRIELEYIPRAGKLGAAIARLFGKEPGRQIADDLHRFKRMMERVSAPTSPALPMPWPRYQMPPL